jgi:hypothetical protein
MNKGTQKQSKSRTPISSEARTERWVLFSRSLVLTIGARKNPSGREARTGLPEVDLATAQASALLPFARLDSHPPPDLPPREIL